MSGYHNDQFFRLNSADSGETSTFTNIGNNGAGWALRGADNPNFIYPDRTVRTEDQRGMHSQSLKRGYIRSLSTYTGGGDSLDIRKCQFQFNPATIGQHVESAQSTLNFAQMDPGQYSVPRATSVNFSFSLLFDRSMEMNNVRVDAPDPDAVNPWQSGDPGQVGVLRDLAAFYGVIGQSIGLEQAAYMEKSVTDALRLEAITSTSETKDADLEKAIANVPGFIRANAANSAFLLPTPVRVLFSSLYIVEGFVTNTEVAMTKFSTAMVPMQCALTVTMEAKYIGFAQKSTFLTWSLEKRAETLQAEEQATKARSAALYSACSSLLGTVNTGLVLRTDTSTNLDGANTVEEALVDVYYDPNSKSSITTLLPVAQGYTEKDDPMVTLFDDGEVTNIAGDSTFLIHGPFDDLSAYSPSTVSPLLSHRGTASVVFRGTTTSSTGTDSIATDSKSWREMANGFSSFKQGSSDIGSFSGSATYNSAKWYVMEASCSMTVTAGGEPIQGKGTAYKIIPPTVGLTLPAKVLIHLNWPTATAGVGTSSSSSSPSVPASNAATNPPPPGGVSNVGGSLRNDTKTGAQ